MPRLWADSIDEHRTLVRRRLVDAFLDLLGERPLDQVTVSAVAERAGLARSAVYNHVDHVHDLALLHAGEVMGEWLATMQAEDPGPSGSAFDRLARLVSSSFEVFAQDRLGGMELSGHLDAQRSAQLFELLAPLMGHIHQVVADGVASGEFVDEDPAELTQFAWATIGGHRTALGSGRADPEEAAALVTRLLRRALVRDTASRL